ncbi:MAG: Chromosome partition protein Smc, partial [Actinomycetota bacterium]
MILVKLRISGFKSFAHLSETAFSPKVNAIVGPNGSGKSNILDAISWVLGEQGPSSLRGAKMDDVIFAGSGSLGPLGRSHVEIVL